MEFVGLVLAVIPLLISAAEHYDDIRKPFTRYSKFDHAFKAFQVELTAQNTLFQTEVKILLMQIMDREQAERILKDPKNWARTDADVDSRLIKHLDVNGPACVEVLRKVKSLLEDIKAKESYFAEVTRQNPKDANFASQSWRHRKAAKVKFAISDSRLEKDIRELRQLNDDFRSLTKQASRLATMHAKQAPTLTLPIARSIPLKHARGMKVHRAIQETSKVLYENLTEACTKHSEHRAFLSLQPLVNKQNADLDIRYEICYCNSPYTVRAPQDLHWITVESRSGCDLTTNDTEHVTSVNVAIPVTDVLKHEAETSAKGVVRKRVASPDPSKICERPKKTVKFVAQSVPERIFVASLSNALPFFKGYQDLCTHLLNHNRVVSGDGRCCLGILGKNPHYELILYLTEPPKSRRASVPLSNILQRLKDGDLEDLQPQEKIRFAKLLATAALQFQSTPWLNNGMWRSESLCLFEPDASPKSSSSSTHLTIPYMDVVVKKNIPKPESPFADSPWINNPILFGLALMLIELAYERPFSTLKNEADDRAGYKPIDTEYATAKRVMKTMSSKLGPRYRNVVQKCLDFGELNTRELQERYHTEVVDVLHGLELDFQKMYLEDI